MKTRSKQKGFTLIELLVVITIIAILASVSVPVFGSIQRKAKLNKSLQHAKQVALALRVYAGDENGLYPGGDTANEAFAELVPELESEKIFYVPGCPWHGSSNSDTARGPDNLWETSEPQGQALGPGENHYAYVTGFNDSSPARFPLIASGFTNQTGQYTDVTTEVGGVWEGKNCIVIYCDGSGESPKLERGTWLLIQDRGGQEFDVLNQTEVSENWVNPEQG